MKTKRDIKAEYDELVIKVGEAMQAPGDIGHAESAFYAGMALGLLSEALNQIAELNLAVSELEALVDELSVSLM